MNKKPSWLLRSLSVFFSAALLTGNISAGSQIVFAESADVTFDSSEALKRSADVFLYSGRYGICPWTENGGN